MTRNELKRRPTKHIPALSDAATARFWSNVDKGETCWNWKGTMLPSEYGRFRFNYEDFSAHRIAYFLVNGALDPSLVIDHLCRNPSCVNPAHLEQVTIKENVRRSSHVQKEYCKRGHKYNENVVRLGSGKFRSCRLCIAIRKKSYKTVERKCLTCGGTFYREPYRISDTDGIFCSEKCVVPTRREDGKFASRRA